MTTSKHLDNAALHDELEDIGSNPSGNTPFSELVERGIARRRVVQGTLAGAAAGFLAPSALAHGRWGDDGKWRRKHKDSDSGELVGFTPVSVLEGASDATVPHISEEYEYQALIPWGTPIQPGGPEYTGDPSTRPTAEEAAEQVGIGHDGMWFYPEDSSYGQYVKYGYKLSSSRGLLVVNHEYGTNDHVTGKPFPESLDDVRLSQHVHGVSVIAIRRRGNGEWKPVRNRANRRIHVNTPVEFSGPAADSPLLQNDAGNAPAGTVNNCGSGPTPWGTYVTCEENFNGYFGSTVPSPEFTEEQQRYGFSENGFGYGWHLYDDRFDLANGMYGGEQHRFGWCVEIDPFNPDAKPVKRTALGRFKHEAIAIKELDDGRIAAYMGDDERFDYCYKFESKWRWKKAVKRGRSPLDEGKLYVARFNDDGTGEWLELTIDNPALAARFSSQAEVLIYARIAADILGATPMDRPEWTTIGKDGEVYWTLTNNTRRTEPNAPNPQAPNPNGHIIRTADMSSTEFAWEIFILASSTITGETAFSSPDAAWADDDGRLFIGTDGGQPQGLQDQLTVFDTSQNPPEPKRLFVGVSGDEITGYTTTPDYRTAFINTQHPGNGDPTATNFPAPTDGVTIPRDCTIVITRKNGGKIGS